MNQLRLTELALSDLDAIECYPVSRWGRDVADKYLADLGAALDRLSQELSLFRARHDYTGRLRFYSVREHVLVGDVICNVGFVLTVWHGAMDFIDRTRPDARSRDHGPSWHEPIQSLPPGRPNSRSI